MIKLTNINKYYNNTNTLTKALNDININLNIGEFVLISGKIGSGKSTLLNIISLLDDFNEGKYLFNDLDFSSLTEDEKTCFRNKYFSFIFQNNYLNESDTVLDNVILPLIINGTSKEEAKIKATKVLDLVKLNTKINEKVVNLSQGEKQRVNICRALILDKNIICCDEILSNLDNENKIIILELLNSIKKDKLILFVSHDLDIVEKYATRIITLEESNLIYDSNNPDNIIKNNFSHYTNKKNYFKTSLLYFIKNIKLNLIFFIILTIIGFFSSFLLLSSTNYLKNDKLYNDTALINSEFYLLYDYYDIDNNDYNNFAYLDNYILSNDKISRLRISPFLFNDINIESIKGSLDISTYKNNLILYLPTNYNTDINLDDKIIFDFIDKKSFIFNITTIIYSDTVNIPFIYTNLEDNLNFKISIYQDILNKYFKGYSTNNEIKINVKYDPNIEESYIKTSKMTSNKYDIYFDNYYLFNNNDLKQISSNNMAINYIELFINDSFLNKYIFNKKCSIYNNDLNNVINILDDNNVDYYYPVDDYIINIKSHVISLGLIILAILIYILLIYLIPFINNHINKYQTKFANLLRIFNYDKKDFFIISIINNLFINLFNILFTYFITYLIYLKFNIININMNVLLFISLNLILVYVSAKANTKSLYDKNIIAIIKE